MGSPYPVRAAGGTDVVRARHHVPPRLGLTPATACVVYAPPDRFILHASRRRPLTDYDDILIALRRITRAIDLRSKALVRSSGLTAPQLLVLLSVRKDGKANPSAIADDVLLSKATVTTIVDRLEAAGLVTRERSVADRRVIEVKLTEDGGRRLDAAPELLQEGFIRRLNTLDDWERKLLVSSVQRIASMLDASDLDAAPILEVGDMSDAAANEK